MPQVTLTVNGKSHTVEVEGRTLLVELLREKLRLTGTHVGCDTSQCGACVVHVDGESVKSCTMLALPKAYTRRRSSGSSPEALPFSSPESMRSHSAIMSSTVRRHNSRAWGEVE